jgi:hypothetical protein
MIYILFLQVLSTTRLSPHMEHFPRVSTELSGDKYMAGQSSESFVSSVYAVPLLNRERVCQTPSCRKNIPSPPPRTQGL